MALFLSVYFVQVNKWKYLCLQMILWPQNATNLNKHNQLQTFTFKSASSFLTFWFLLYSCWIFPSYLFVVVFWGDLLLFILLIFVIFASLFQGSDAFILLIHFRSNWSEWKNSILINWIKVLSVLKGPVRLNETINCISIQFDWVLSVSSFQTINKKHFQDVIPLLWGSSTAFSHSTEQLKVPVFKHLLSTRISLLLIYYF